MVKKKSLTLTIPFIYFGKGTFREKEHNFDSFILLTVS
jgi:hypothetical protein